MKRFNSTIDISISVDAVADRLLATIDPDFKHREMLAEAIVGSAMQHSAHVGYIYNALTGFGNDINFKVGDVVNCSEKIWYKDSIEGERKGHQIGTATIVDIDLYSVNKLSIAYEYTHYSNSEVLKTKEVKWVDHTKCDHISSPALEVEEY